MVDCSVLAALIFAEPAAAEARVITSGMELYAPRLLAYELTNVAWKKARQIPERRELIISRLQQGMRLGIRLRDVSHTLVCRLALSADLTAYDASYLYLARSLGLPLLTFDRRLAAAASI